MLVRGVVARGHGRNDGQDGPVWQQEALPFIGEEKERAIAPVITERSENFLRQLNRPTEGSAEVVIPKRLFLDEVGVVEEVVGVERVIAKVVVGGAVKLIFARARHKRYLRARRASELRRESRGLNLELLQRVNRDQITKAALYVGGRNRARDRRVVPREVVAAEIGAHPVYGEVV